MKTRKPKTTGDPETDALRAEVRRRMAEEDAAHQLRMMGFTTLADLPSFVPDEQNPAVLVRGRWLERGGSAWIVSTSGTGKSILAMQIMLCFTLGLPFAGIDPNFPLRCWYVQSEDSETRLGIDRDDVTAELAEQHPEIPAERWADAWGRIHFVPVRGVGGEFLQDIAMKLETARNYAVLPDLLVVNPFLAVVGGPITDGAYVTPFLRGGEINRVKTEGFQKILEHYGVGALVFHHTPKPPTEKEVQAWLKSAFPEYQGAGSSDITNWGRSFITMMRVPNKPGFVCLTAGKNGADLGWDVIDGATRRYLAWSKSRGVTGRTRHAWRELDDEELAEIVKDSGDRLLADVQRIVDKISVTPMTSTELKPLIRKDISEPRWRVAWAWFKANLSSYGFAAWNIRYGRPINDHVFYGVSEEAKARAEASCKNWFESNGVTGCNEVTASLVHPTASRGDGVQPPFRGGCTTPHVTPPETPTSDTPQSDESPEVIIQTEALQI